MSPIIAFLILFSLIAFIVCTIAALFFAVKKKIYWKHYLAGTFLSFILFFTLIIMSPTPLATKSVEESSKTEQLTLSQPVAPKILTVKAILGAPVENFKKTYGELHSKLSSAENQSYTFLKPRISISGNHGTPETVQSIQIDLRKYDETTHQLSRPETFPIQSIEEINQIVQNYLPEDAILIKEKKFKDPSSDPLGYAKTLRLYKSKWLAENLIPFAALADYDRSNFLPDGLFTVLIKQVNNGYLQIVLIFSSDEWGFIDANWQEVPLSK